MPLLYTHLIPATFGGRARMNVANALAAAAAAWAAGAHLHDIRQGLRTFTTSFFQAPGRLNVVDVDGFRVVIDYCHNVDGMRRLAEFVDRMMVEAADEVRAGSARRRPGRGPGRAIGVHRHPGRPARRRPARVRRDRGRARSTRSSSARTRTCAAARPARRRPTSSRACARRAKAGTARAARAEKVLDEMTAVRAALRRAIRAIRRGCVDDAVGVYREAMAAGTARRRRSPTGELVARGLRSGGGPAGAAHGAIRAMRVS